MVRARAIIWLAVSAACATGDAHAGIVIGATRIVFPGASRDVAVRIENKGQEPGLVQAWIDDGDDRSTPESAHVPFAITPPVFRIDAGRGHALRIVHIGDVPPAKHEVLYWLNVLEIPPSPDAGKSMNTLQFAFRHRLKLLHRPSGLSVEPSAAPSLLVWSIETDGALPRLHVSNPSPYVLSFNEVAIMGAGSPGKKFPLGGGMVAAEGKTTWSLPEGASLPTGAVVMFATINDYGAVVPGTAKVVAVPGAND
ncbi:chaperone protein EcpD [Luteibacter sp. OK325]|uniref:fimbrial biogenesis chaperone n=1 Tax=Luteibacter sp. OK325 TaxID=2135670 RepID=UPI000D378517|nr:fimbria/pilus periplasmic chaperone [Luteibacter sp. OK325]PTR34843.1 chaperone protein EcpD [Luteibacter sp. OK325]